ncbi:MAG: primosomal protein N' [Clostridia bacterium]|nr:primosomal protein N' [Clostridia bacterium]
MNVPVTASIAVENTAYSFDKLFDYLIPDSLTDCISVGCRVLVSFGTGSKKRQGFVFALSDTVPEGVKLKSILSVEDPEPLLTQEMITLATRLADTTFCTLFDAAKALLPSGLCLNVVESYRVTYECTVQMPEDLSADELQIMEYLQRKDSFVPQNKIYKDLGFTAEAKIIAGLYGKGYLIKNVDTNRRVNDAVVKTVYLMPEYLQDNTLPFKPTSKQTAVIDLLRNIGSGTSREVAYYTGVSASVIENLYRKGIVGYDDVEVYRTPIKMRQTPRNVAPINLTGMQQEAYNKLSDLYNSQKAAAALLFGVTGSGKTKVYMRLIDDAAKDNKGVIVLVPEISLTPQLMEMFYARYGEKVAVMHSGLSVGERTDEWKRIRRGEANIVIGTRSASFAPVQNLSLMIIDEEQESTYKSEMTPRYHARDVARFRCAYNNALLVLASATPSVDTYASALAGRYTLTELTERYSKSGLPEVKVVDISQKENMGGMQTISTALAEEIGKNLENSQQTILLINRRGFNTFVACTKCKSVMMCPNCSISMTYHSANDRLMCHYCGYSEPVKTSCPDCGADTVRFSGFGTQKVEQELNILFPDARILRMDADTTTAKNSHEKLFKQFADGDYDIMVGTQMVAKGLDFPNVTLVGVISVDQQLYNDDYKSTERAFDLLTQVVGRSGRGEKSGRAVIQTLVPENTVIELAAQQDYKSFYDTEIMIRKGMIYPPYCDICVINFVGQGEVVVRNGSREFFRLFKAKLTEKYSNEKVVVLGPVAPKIAKISNNYRERLIIKCKNSPSFRQLVAECLKEFSKLKLYGKITAYADMNPESMF